MEWFKLIRLIICTSIIQNSLKSKVFHKTKCEYVTSEDQTRSYWVRCQYFGDWPHFHEHPFDIRSISKSMNFQMSSTTTRNIFNYSYFDITYRPTFHSDNNSEIPFCTCPQVKSKSIQLGPTNITSPYFRISEPAQGRTYKQHTTETIMPLARDLVWSHTWVCGVLKYLSELPQMVSVVFHLYTLPLSWFCCPKTKTSFTDWTKLSWFSFCKTAETSSGLRNDILNKTTTIGNVQMSRSFY
jgi:hypothetical protein